MKEKGERERIGEGVWWKRKEGRGSWPKGHILPLVAPPTEVGGLGRRQPAGLPATATDGERGKRWRAMRGFFSLPHLELGSTVESAPRGETAVVMGSRWWLDVAVRRGNGGAVVVRWCGEDGAGLFIAGMRRFGGRYLCSSVLRRGRGGRPESRLPVMG
jgi:hypothetical protein